MLHATDTPGSRAPPAVALADRWTTDPGLTALDGAVISISMTAWLRAICTELPCNPGATAVIEEPARVALLGMGTWTRLCPSAMVTSYYT